MRKTCFIVGCVLLVGILVSEASPPTRDNTYVAGTVIQPTPVTKNEDAIFTYLQNGVDTYAAKSIGTAAIQDNAITSAQIQDGTITQADLAFTLPGGGNVLPSGAVFFMFTGACPAWTTDVSATYSNLFLRVNATAKSTGGGDTHTHPPGSYAGTVHTHDFGTLGVTGAGQLKGGSDGAWGFTTSAAQLTSGATGSGGGGAITGTSGSASNVPAYVTAILCQVN